MAAQFTAQYPGKCKAVGCPHGNIISVGQKMTWNRKAKGQTFHVECFTPDVRVMPSELTPDSDAFKNAKPLSEEEQTPIEVDFTEERNLGEAMDAHEQEGKASQEAKSSEDKVRQAAELLTQAIQSGVTQDSLKKALAETLKHVDTTIDEVEDLLVKKIKDLAPSKGTDEAAVKDLIEKHAVKRIEVFNVETDVTKDLGVQHESFEILLKLVQHIPNVWVSGPAGSGKTSAAQKISEALDLPFYFAGAIAEPYSLLGFKSATGEYQRTAFREAFENGGLFLFDEIDSSEPVAIMPFNAALANGRCAFPDGVIERHAKCHIIASANTWGHGANDNYVGRLKLDGAFLDRFVKLPWAVDEKLERALAGNDAWVNRVQHVRRNVTSKGIRVLVTPRASIYGSKLLAAGVPQPKVEEYCLRNGMTNEQWDSVKA